METNSNAPAQASRSSKKSSGKITINRIVMSFLKQQEVSDGRINALSDEQVKILNYSGVRYAIREKLISLEDIGNPVRMNANKIKLDNDKTVTIYGQEVDLSALLNARDRNVELLHRDVIKRCLSEKRGTINEVLEADLSKGYSLDFPIRCVREGIITLRQALEISTAESYNYTWPKVDGEDMTTEQENLWIYCLQEEVFTFAEMPQLQGKFTKEMLSKLENAGERQAIKEARAQDPKLSLIEALQNQILPTNAVPIPMNNANTKVLVEDLASPTATDLLLNNAESNNPNNIKQPKKLGIPAKVAFVVASIVLGITAGVSFYVGDKDNSNMAKGIGGGSLITMLLTIFLLTRELAKEPRTNLARPSVVLANKGLESQI